jgi:flavodoxin
MKKLLLLTLAFFYLTATAQLNAQSQRTQKILIAYFSWGGTTRSLAGQIQERLAENAYPVDMFEIKTVNPYPTEYRPTTEVAKLEQETNARPALATHVNNMDSYDVVFLGYPIWYRTIPMALCTFLEEYNFSGKTIIPFCTFGANGRGSGLGPSADDIKKYAPQATVRDALALVNDKALNSPQELNAWPTDWEWRGKFPQGR